MAYEGREMSEHDTEQYNYFKHELVKLIPSAHVLDESDVIYAFALAHCEGDVSSENLMKTTKTVINEVRNINDNKRRFTDGSGKRRYANIEVSDLELVAGTEDDMYDDDYDNRRDEEYYETRATLVETKI